MSLLTIIQSKKYNLLGEIICHKFRIAYMIIQFIISGTNFPDHAPEVLTKRKSCPRHIQWKVLCKWMALQPESSIQS